MSSFSEAPSGERIHIGFFGRRNAGKSSLVNAVTGQELSVVSEIKGTTTDPVRKAMELLPLGPVLIIDTPGFDDEGGLGALRVQKTREILQESDAAVLVADATQGLGPAEEELLRLFREQGTPYLIAMNKRDLAPRRTAEDEPHTVAVSALQKENIHTLKERMARLVDGGPQKPLLADLLSPGALAVLVTPIDSAAPKGRMILPQQQALRDALEAGACSLVVRETELALALAELRQPPALVVTDSQAFARVAAAVPEEVPLTSFSILFARYKGYLASAVAGVQALSRLPAGASILIAEGCTHHRQCDDIGTVKLPRWIRSHTGKDFEFSFCAGREFPEDLRRYALVVHCGACMLNERAMKARLRAAQAQGVPLTNYGVLIAWMQGILERCLRPLQARG